MFKDPADDEQQRLFEALAGLGEPELDMVRLNGGTNRACLMARSGRSPDKAWSVRIHHDWSDATDRGRDRSPSAG